MTTNIALLDSGICEFDCKVISLYSNNEHLEVVIDQTAFFPEGGGQSSDIGYLNDVYVESVEYYNGNIIHVVENTVENTQKLALGSKIHGKVDYKKRFSDMQQHSGEHIFSGIVHNLYGCDNVGFHLGKSAVTVDFNRIFTENEVCKVEHLVNEVIWQNLEVKVFYPTNEEIKHLKYRKKKEITEKLRLIEIPGVDICACCAPHVKHTGEIGVFEIVSYEKFKSGTRFNILCGERALVDIKAKLNQNRKIGALLSTNQLQTYAMVEKLKNEKAKLEFDIVGLKRENIMLLAQEVKSDKHIIFFSDTSDTLLMRELADVLSDKADDFAAVFAPHNDTFKYVIISKTGYNILLLSNELNKQLSGRGGGKNGIVQGSLLGKKSDIEAFFNEMFK